MPKVKFTAMRVVDDHRKGTKQEERYEAGEIYEMSEASAARWVSRGVATYVDGETETRKPRGSKKAEGGSEKSADGEGSAEAEQQRRRQALQ